MDYRENFAHLLQHMIRELSAECGNGCPVSYRKDGGTTWRSARRGEYTGPSLENLFAAMKEVGFVAQIRVATNYYEYFPTTLGIEFLEKRRHPLKTWLKENWFATLVAGATITVATINVLVAYMSGNGM